ncbi:hypothetical protein BYT27DRAFT_6457650 [Phlegmacium glaucopus]|nr:hypothetical protein BYT27DRAFT_6457650 [Phlegmacium glaucopus]
MLATTNWGRHVELHYILPVLMSSSPGFISNCLLICPIDTAVQNSTMILQTRHHKDTMDQRLALSMKLFGLSISMLLLSVSGFMDWRTRCAPCLRWRRVV